MAKTTTLPSVPAIKRLEDRPKVLKAKARVTEARQKFDMVNAESARASGLLKDRRQAIRQIQSRVAMGDEKEEVLHQAAEEVRRLETLSTTYGDHEQGKAEFIAPYEAERRVAYIEEAEAMEEEYAAAIGARIDYIRGIFPDIAQACAEVLEMAPVIDRINHSLTAHGIPEAQIRQPWKNGEMGVIQRTLQAIKPFVSNG